MKNRVSIITCLSSSLENVNEVSTSKYFVFVAVKNRKKKTELFNILENTLISFLAGSLVRWMVNILLQLAVSYV